MMIIDRLIPARLQRRWSGRNASLWLRSLIVAGVILGSAALAPWASQRYLLLLAGAGVALIVLQWPPLGLGALIVAAPLVPFALGTGTETGVNVAIMLVALLIGLWVLDMVVRRRQVQLNRSRTILPLLALSVVALLSFLAGNLTWSPFARTASLAAQLGGLAVYLLSAGVFLLVAHQVRSLRWLERLTWLFLAIGSLFVVLQLVPGLRRLAARLFEPGATGSMFRTWLVALAFGQAAFNRGLRPRWRLALGMVAAGTLYTGFTATRAWASSWLPPLVALLVALWAGAPRLGLLATLVAVAVVALNVQDFVDVIMVGDQEWSLLTRLEGWRITAEIVKASPVLGLGPANYYHYTPLYPIMGYYVRFSSHNQYVDLVAQTGLLGLGCFLWFAWEAGRLGWRLRARAPDGFARAYTIGAFAGLMGTLATGMLGDWILPFVYNVGLAGFRASVLGWLFLGGLGALEHLCQPADQPGT